MLDRVQRWRDADLGDAGAESPECGSMGHGGDITRFPAARSDYGVNVHIMA
jgi:hypothetical protein